MSIVALLTGGIFGTFAALIALFGMGVEWSTGAAIYFATAALIALPLIGVGTVHRLKNKDGPLLSDWERELHECQPDAILVRSNPDKQTENSIDRNVA